MGEDVVGGAGVGDDDDAEAGGVGGLVTRHGVLEGDGGGGVDLQAAAGFEVEIGGGFAVGDVLAADDGGEGVPKAEALEVGVDVDVRGIGGDGEGNGGGAGVFEQGGDAGEDGLR